MHFDASLLSAFDDIANRCPPSRRAEILDRLTSLFLDKAGDFGEQNIQLFDEVFNRLVARLEAAARIKLSVSLASAVNVPPQIVLRLAHDDDLCVAGPLLQNCVWLAESDLIELAKSKSQGHLLAISARSRITEPVTDVLVRRGDREVLRGVAGNLGARISHGGFVSLVTKAGKDGILAETVGQRADIPEQLFRTLLFEATAVVQKRLFAAATPEVRARMLRLATKIANELGSRTTPNNAAIDGAIQKVGGDTKLEQSKLVKLVDEGDYEGTIAVLASRCNVPITVINRIAAHKDKDPALILCKGAGLDWPSARAVILSRTKQDGVAHLTLDNKRRVFEKMSIEAAHEVISHWKTLYKADTENGQSNLTI